MKEKLSSRSKTHASASLFEIVAVMAAVTFLGWAVLYATLPPDGPAAPAHVESKQPSVSDSEAPALSAKRSAQPATARTGSSASGIQEPAFQGEWIALGRANMVLAGDMIVAPTTITFRHHGPVASEVIHFDGRAYLLKLAREVDYGRFMRLGPLGTMYNGRHESVEVAYYSTREAAMAWEVQPESLKNSAYYSYGANSWGVYIRETWSQTQNAPASPVHE